jgi:hypothetical protein
MFSLAVFCKKTSFLEYVNKKLQIDVSDATLKSNGPDTEKVLF